MSRMTECGANMSMPIKMNFDVQADQGQGQILLQGSMPNIKKIKMNGIMRRSPRSERRSTGQHSVYLVMKQIA